MGSNQKSSAIVIFDAARHIFDIPKCDVHSAGSCNCRERLPNRLRAFRDHVAVVDQVQIHRIVRSGGVARLDGVGHAAVRADGLLDELFARNIDKEGNGRLEYAHQAGNDEVAAIPGWLHGVAPVRIEFSSHRCVA